MIHLADYMAANNLNDADVAARIERSRETVSRIRRRKVRPDWETIERIKKFTNGQVTADDFLSLAPEVGGLDETTPEAAT